jgi:hypothetical protein
MINGANPAFNVGFRFRGDGYPCAMLHRWKGAIGAGGQVVPASEFPGRFSFALQAIALALEKPGAQLHRLILRCND